MLSILGSLLGFASSAVPAITDSFARKQDKKHELDMMKLQAELRAKGFDHDLKMHDAMGRDREHDRLIQHDIAMQNSGGWVGALQKSVRPVITYAFFILFATIEITLLIQALKMGTNFSEAIQLLWDEDTKAIFAAVISFWFGSRAIEKSRRR